MVIATGINNLEEGEGRRCKEGERSPARSKAKRGRHEGRRSVAEEGEVSPMVWKAKRAGAMEGEALPEIWSVRESGYCQMSEGKKRS